MTRASLPGTCSTGADSRQSPLSCLSPPPAPEDVVGSPAQRLPPAFSGSEGCRLPGPSSSQPSGQGWGTVTPLALGGPALSKHIGDRTGGQPCALTEPAFRLRARPAGGISGGVWCQNPPDPGRAGAAFLGRLPLIPLLWHQVGRLQESWKILLSRSTFDIVPPLSPS